MNPVPIRRAWALKWLGLILPWSMAWGETRPLTGTTTVEYSEAARIGRDWEPQLRRGDVSPLVSRVDFRVLTERAIAGVPSDAEAKQAFVERFAPGASASFQQGLKSFASLRFLGVPQTNAAGGVVFRCLSPDGGVNYHRYLLEQQAGGQVRIPDVYSMAAGDWFSETIRREFLASEGVSNPGLAARLKGADAEWVRNASLVAQAGRLVQQRQLAEFLTLYRQMPVALQEDRDLLLMRLIAGMSVEPAEVGEGTKLWERLYPGHPGLDLVSFDKLAQRREHARSAEALERIETFVGGDPHLRSLRGLQLGLAGDRVKGRQLAEEALLAELDLVSGYDALLGIGLAAKEFGMVARDLDRAVDFVAVDVRDLVVQQPLYKEFRDSPEGKRWIAKPPIGRRPNTPAAKLRP